MKPNISVVVPTYRRDGTLRKLLAEVVRQAKELETEIEIVVVDNAVEATTRELVGEFIHAAKYVPAPRRGIAYARNVGVASSSGRYVIFVDDDQLPDAGWLRAFVEAAATGDAAYFGRVVPDFSLMPDNHLAEIALAMFSRNLDVPSQADVTALRAYLGTGNSMFDRQRCFAGGEPFDVRFDGGGEDVFLLSLLSRNPELRFRWSPEATVREVVPPSRVQGPYLLQRRFKNGQLRSRVEWMSGRPLRTLLWMGVGLGQFLASGTAALFLLPLNRRRAEVQRISAHAGLGKVLWYVR